MVVSSLSILERACPIGGRARRFQSAGFESKKIYFRKIGGFFAILPESCLVPFQSNDFLFHRNGVLFHYCLILFHCCVVLLHCCLFLFHHCGVLFHCCLILFHHCVVLLCSFKFEVRQIMMLVSNDLQRKRHFCFDANPYAIGRRGLRRNRNVWRATSSELSHFELESTQPNKSPEPTAVGACRSAVAVHVASRRWLSFLR